MVDVARVAVAAPVVAAPVVAVDVEEGAEDEPFFLSLITLVGFGSGTVRI